MNPGVNFRGRIYILFSIYSVSVYICIYVLFLLRGSHRWAGSLESCVLWKLEERIFAANWHSLPLLRLSADGYFKLPALEIEAGVTRF